MGLRLVKAHCFCFKKFTKYRANPTEEAAMEADVLFVSAASVLLFLIIFLSTNLIRRGPLTSHINIHIELESKNTDNPIPVFSRTWREEEVGQKEVQ